jgi:hypothetical protein
MLSRVGWPDRVFNTARLATLIAVDSRVPLWPAARFERIQARWVRRMVAHVYVTVPYFGTDADHAPLRQPPRSSGDSSTR